MRLVLPRYLMVLTALVASLFHSWPVTDVCILCWAILTGFDAVADAIDSLPKID